MNLTEEQRAICRAARDLGVGSSLKIQAFAGTGKTTTLAAIFFASQKPVAEKIISDIFKKYR